jgi:hypothetical protein
VGLVSYPIVGDYEYEHPLIEKLAPMLIKERPFAMFEALVNQLRYVSATKSSPVGVSRSAIENTDQDFMERPVDALIECTRDALSELARVAHPDMHQILERLLSDDDPLLNRLALHVLSEFPDYLVGVSPGLLFPPGIYDATRYHEQMRLLHLQFQNLPEEIRVQIHSVLLDGLPVEALNQHQPAIEQHERAKWRLLSVLPDDVLTEKERLERARLFDERGGPPSEPFFLSWGGRLERLDSWVNSDELRTVLGLSGYSGLIDALRDPRRHFEIGRWFEEYETWQQLEPLILEDPTRMLSLSTLLEPTDFPGAGYYFGAYRTVALRGDAIDWRPLVQAIARLSSETLPANDPYVADLLKTLAGLDPPIPNSLLHEAFSVAVSITGKSCTPLEHHAEIADFATHNLNSAAGNAAYTILAAAFRWARESASGTRGSTDAATPDYGPESLALLDRAVNEGWGGAELRHAIGFWLTRIVWARPEWLPSRLDRLLPTTGEDLPESVGAWAAFWSGYLITDRLTAPVMAVLREAYLTVTSAVGDDTHFISRMGWGGDDRRALANHLLVGWLRGYPGFERDSLLKTFMNKAPEHIRASVVDALARELRDAMRGNDAEWRENVQRELLAFWRERTIELKSTLGRVDTSQELGSFARWLEQIGLGPTELRDELEVLAGHMPTSEFRLISAYLAHYGDKEPEPVSKLVRIVADRAIETPSAIWHMPDFAKILSALTDTGDWDAAAMVRGIVSDLLERRGLDLRYTMGGTGTG